MIVEKNVNEGETQFLWIEGTELGILAQVAYVPSEEIKSNVVLWGLEFPGGEIREAAQFILSWAKSDLLVYTHGDLK